MASRPEPLAPDACLAFLAWGAVTAGILLSYALTRLNAGSWGTVQLAACALGFIILSVPAGFVAAALLHAFSALSGGQGGFWRSVSAVAVLGPTPALLVAGLWAPDPGWLAVPTLYATWLAVSAVEKLHDAPTGQVLMVVGVCGALLAGAEVVARDKVTLALVRLENAATVLSNNPIADEGSRRSAALAAPMPIAGAESQPDRLSGAPGGAGPVEADAAPLPGTAPRSSLDYLRTPGEDDEGGPPTAPAQEPMMAQAQNLQNAGNNLIQNLLSQIDKNPGGLNGLPSEQAAIIKKLLSQVQNKTGAGKGGPKMTPQETQKLLQEVMGTLGQKATEEPASTQAPKKRRRASTPVE